VPVDSTGVPQRDIFDVLKERLLNHRVEPELAGSSRSGLAWSILPTISYNPVYGFAAGASVSAAGRLGQEPDSRPSALSISASYSTTKQLLLQFRGDIFSPSSNYLVRADSRYMDTARSTWGLGPMHPDQQEFPMSFQFTRVYGTVFRRTGKSIYVGLGYHFDDYANIVDDRAVLGEPTPFTEYSGGAPTRTRASGVSLNLLSDSRDNLVNPMAGYYLSGSFRDYLESLGSDRNWQELWLDVRLYPHVPRRSNNILAFWIYSWLSFGPGPYLGLPSIGWDTYGRGGRGYLQGRIRGQNQIYIETEYRLQLTRDGLLGAVGFFNIMATTVPGQNTFGDADKGGGVGLRIKFNKRSNTNLTIDHGWGENGSQGWFLGTTEVF
jgi:outer membrane protein assembly factor BamA